MVTEKVHDVIERTVQVDVFALRLWVITSLYLHAPAICEAKSKEFHSVEVVRRCIHINLYVCNLGNGKGYVPILLKSVLEIKY